jgi:hypothetical protein
MLALCGCATVMETPNVSISVRSEPEGAQFVVREDVSQTRVREGTTPLPLFVPRGTGFFSPAKYSIVVSKEGYETQTVYLRSSVSGWYWLNLLFLVPGWIGMAFVDPANGAMWQIDAPPPIALRPLAPGQ